MMGKPSEDAAGDSLPVELTRYPTATHVAQKYFHHKYQETTTFEQTNKQIKIKKPLGSFSCKFLVLKVVFSWHVFEPIFYLFKLSYTLYMQLVELLINGFLINNNKGAIKQ